jgi:hypothetical protein
MANDSFDEGLDVVPGAPGSRQQQGQFAQNAGLGQSNQGMLGGPVNGLRQDVQSQINSAIEHFAGQIPGGSQHADFAKQAVSGVLDELQRRLESQAASSMGGVGGSLFGNPGSGSSSGSGSPLGNQGGMTGHGSGQESQL